MTKIVKLDNERIFITYFSHELISDELRIQRYKFDSDTTEIQLKEWINKNNPNIKDTTTYFTGEIEVTDGHYFSVIVNIISIVNIVNIKNLEIEKVLSD